MNKSPKVEELIHYSRVLYERKLLHSTGGNTSVRDGECVLISQTGAELGSLTENEIVKVDLDGKVLEGTAPSKEMGMHLAMYRARENAGAVIHAHPTFSITHSTMISEPTTDSIPPYTAAFYVRAGRVPFIPYHPSGAHSAGRVPFIPYHPSGAHSLHEAVETLASNYHAILLRQHGLLVSAAVMTDALGIVEEIEQCCQISITAGAKGEWLSEAQCRQIDEALGRSW